MEIVPNLHFNGNCEGALKLYESAFGARAGPSSCATRMPILRIWNRFSTQTSKSMSTMPKF